jgi:hypothetical protein
VIAGRCHCGQVGFEIPEKPQTVTACNCSICRRLGWVLAYFPAEAVRFTGLGRASGYIQGDRTLASFHCPTCGCATHWRGRGEHAARVGVNVRLVDPADLEGVTVRFLDGADTWDYVGEAPFATNTVAFNPRAPI